MYIFRKYISFLKTASYLMNKHVRSGTRGGWPVCPLLFNLISEILTNATRQEKTNRSIRFNIKKIKLSLFVGDMIIQLENSKVLMIKLTQAK